jgi:hypothetical protein
MKGQLMKIQELIKSKDMTNKELGMELLKAYCESTKRWPTLLNLLRKGKQYVTDKRYGRIHHRLSKELSLRMFDIIRINLLEYGLLFCTIYTHNQQLVSYKRMHFFFGKKWYVASNYKNNKTDWGGIHRYVGTIDPIERRRRKQYISTTLLTLAGILKARRINAKLDNAIVGLLSSQTATMA